MLDGMVSDLIRNTGKRIEESRIRSLDDIRNCPHRLASFSSGVEKERREAKKFLFANLYFTPSGCIFSANFHQIKTISTRTLVIGLNDPYSLCYHPARSLDVWFF